jgi:probable F420-dependent oxidoreductase
MEIGVVFPQTEIGGDVENVRLYASSVEQLGYRHVMIYDHILGADPATHQNWSGYYDVHTTFHEPFVLYGFLAGITSLDLLTGIIVLPQRQTALVAKQAAEIDLLTRGRFRLGVGLGWNAVEYEAMGKSFRDRGRRIEEQVTLLRRLWSEPSVTFKGQYEQVTGAGLAPAPLQRPIPVWFGGESSPAYERAGRLADGWIPDHMVPGAKLDAAKAEVEAAAERAGRDPAKLGLQARIRWGNNGVADLGIDRLVEIVEQWRISGATHIAINTMDAGLANIEAHIEVLQECAEALKLGT